MARSKLSASERGDRLFALASSTPAIVVIAALFAYPLGYSVLMSLYRLNDKTPQKTAFVGLDNYAQLLSDPNAYSALGRTAVFCLFTVLGGVALAVGVAVLLQAPFRGRNVVRVLLLVPWAIPPVVNGIMWKLIFDGSYGVLNRVLQGIGLIDQPIQWLANPTLTMGVLIFAELWKLFPFLTLLTIAAMQAIPSNIYRAASIDGAGAWSRFWRMTLPNLRGTLMLLFIVQSMWSIKVFDSIFVLTGGSGGPAEATTTVNFLAYLTTFSFLDRGYGAAMSIGIMLLVIAVTIFWVLLLGQRRRRNA